MLRNVLVVAYYFPPMGLSGVQRTLKFVKYLPDFGWHPTVLTVEPQGYLAKDDSFLLELSGKDVRIVRTAPVGPAKWFGRKRDVVPMPAEWKRKIFRVVSDTFFIPDNKRGWIRKAVGEAVKLHSETPFDMIFATAPPFTDFLIGREIKKRINKPLVVDYRDPWVEYPFRFTPTPLHRWRHVALERKVLRSSSHVVTTNRRVKEQIISRHPFLTYHDIDIIPQGYDPEDFPPTITRRGRRSGSGATPGEKMRVTYAGVFWEDRVPDYFLQGLHDLLAEQPRLRGRIEAVFVGNFREENERLVARLGLQDTVRVLGYQPHPQCIKEMVDSDLLWLTVSDDTGSPGKAYEYIGARKPILGLVPEGFLRATIREAGGTVVEPTDVAGVKNALAGYFEKFEKRHLAGPPDEVVHKYNRVSLTNDLVKIFESLYENH
jgi:glycosyltransferase involved in cell wall biosynthesis